MPSCAVAGFRWWCTNIKYVNEIVITHDTCIHTCESSICTDCEVISIRRYQFRFCLSAHHFMCCTNHSSFILLLLIYALNETVSHSRTLWWPIAGISSTFGNDNGNCEMSWQPRKLGTWNKTALSTTMYVQCRENSEIEWRASRLDTWKIQSLNAHSN